MNCTGFGNKLREENIEFLVSGTYSNHWTSRVNTTRHHVGSICLKQESSKDIDFYSYKVTGWLYGATMLLRRSLNNALSKIFYNADNFELKA
jgi:hypothetical protein